MLIIKRFHSLVPKFHFMEIITFKGTCGVPTVAQWVKDPALLQLWHRSKLWLGFDPSPGNFHMFQGQPKKVKKKKELVLTYDEHWIDSFQWTKENFFYFVKNIFSRAVGFALQNSY